MPAQKPFAALVLLTLLVTALLAACAPAQPAAAPTPTTFTLQDALGREFALKGPAARVVSLAPSNTELLFAIGAGSQVVGRDEFSNYPPEAKDLPTVGGSNGQYDLEAIAALKPDLVLATGINTPEQVKSISDLGIAVFYLGNPDNFNALYANLELVGRLTGREAEAKALANSLEARVKAVQDRMANVAARPVVFYEIDGTDPAKPFTSGAGTFLDQIITMAGGQNVGGSMETPWGQISLEQLLVLNPDYIILGDANYGTTPEMVMQRPGWEAIKAVQNQQVFAFDDDTISRPGPRLVDGLEAMAKLIHPEIP